jgi:hypothetical protein
MATTKTARSSDRSERGHRSLMQQPIAFLGLFLAPFGGLLTAWAIHLYIVGWDWRGWVVQGSSTALGVTNTLTGVAAVLLAGAAWHFAEHRKTPMRVALTGSVGSITVLFGVSIYVGPHRWWGLTFILVAWFVAGMWALTRLNVTRSDSRHEPAEEKETWLDKIGLKGTRGKVKEQVHDADGNLVRTTISGQSSDGGTLSDVQGAVPHLESKLATPAGMTTATGNPERADQWELDILHVDPLKNRLPYGPPSHPGGSIEDPLNFAAYNNGHPLWCYLGGGPVAVNPTGLIIMGTTRAGKTLGENLLYTEAGTRTDVVILYMNKAKGLQDWRGIAPVTEVAIISDSEGDYSSAFTRLGKMIKYRSDVLGEYGISAWTANRCYHNPPQRKANGQPVPMAPMPFLMVHVGEADAILENYKSDEGAIFVASKGLSLGIATAVSLQRAGHDSMPTGLRDNLGARICYGTLTATATGMALSEPTMDAGAHPENWGARKPGYFYFEGPGVDETLYPKFAKTYSLAPGMRQDASIEEHNVAMQEEMLRRNLESAPRMARLDRGSAESTGKVGDAIWWDLMAGRTQALRLRVGATATGSQAVSQPTAPVAGPASANMTATDRVDATATPQPYEPPFADDDDEEDGVQFATTDVPEGGDPDSMDAAAEIRSEVAETDSVEGLELYPDFGDGETWELTDVDTPLEMPAELAGMSWADDRPEPASRGEAIEAVRETLVSLMDDPARRDPEDDAAALIRVQDVTRVCKFRARGWVSGVIADISTGSIDPPIGITMERADDRPAGPGKPNWYRLRRSGDDHRE